jgi:hypothetical protein
MRSITVAILTIATTMSIEPAMSQVYPGYRSPYTEEAPLPLPPPYWYSWGIAPPYYGSWNVYQPFYGTYFGDMSPEYMKRQDPRYVPALRNGGGVGN